MDDSSKRGKPDSDTISLEQAHERDYWTKKFGVSIEKLREAVFKVGKSKRKVEEYLKGK